DGSAGATLTLRAAAAPLLPEDMRRAAMPAEVTLDAALDARQRLALRRLAVQVPAGQAEAEGSADLAGQTLDVSARVALGASTVLGPLLPPAARWDALRAEGRATGSMNAPRVILDAALEGFGSDTPALAAALGATPRVALRAALPDRLESLSLDGAALRVTAEGDVGETLDATLRAHVADLAPLLPGMAGALDAELRATGPRSDPSLAITARGERVERAGQVLEALDLALNIATPLSAPRAEGRLRATYAGLAATLDLSALPEGERVRLERLAAGFGPARLAARGVLDPQAATFAGDASLEVADLAPFSALAGTPLTGRSALRGVFDVRDGVQGLDVALDIPQASVGGTALGGKVTMRGSLAALEAVVEAQAAEARLNTRARLTQDGATRRVEIAEMLLRRGTDSLRLTAPARVTLAADGGVGIETLALTTGRGGTLRAEGRWGPENADIRATLQALPVAAIAALAAPDVAVEGVIGGEARVTGPVADPSARFRIEATGLRSPEPAMRGVPAARIVVEGTAGARAAEVRLDAAAGNALRANGTARLPNGFAANAPLAVRLDANADLAALAGPLLAAGSQRVAGRLTVQAEVGGTVGAPRIGGQATLANGAFRDLAQGVTLTDIAASIRGDGERVTIERLDARTPGGGTLGVTGTLSPFAPGLPVEIAVTARGARPLRSDLVSSAFDADLRFLGRALEEARLAGRIAVQRMDITVPERLPASVQHLDGVRERGTRPAGTPPLNPPPPAGAPTGMPNIALEIAVEAPRAVFVRGRGIDAEFGGTLGIGGTVAAPAVTGGLNLRRGNISVFDRRIDFRRGTIAFDAGTLVPSLDFLASSRAREVTANVTVTGPANDPRLEFSSTPELPQDEILARLLFDRRASELSPFQLAQLAQVLAGAAGIETPGAGGIIDRIRRALALDRLAVGEERNATNTRTQGATLETGRYVADGVYLGVRQGTEGGAPRVGVQIDLLPRLRLDAETGGSSAGGDRVGLSFEWEY
ncbi:translocation/assembly module TamB domain-containing protein, partial [Neoroseomonas soli]